MEEMEENSGVVELDPESEPPHAVPEISLHALSGVSTPRTMLVTGLVRGRQLHILIDSGSTHNFVSLKFAKRLACSTTPALAFQVMVANGERLRCDEIYLAVPMEIQGYKFRTNMYPIDLQGSDVVLGIQWLQNLGRVLHDWSKLSMEFSVNGHTFVIHGDEMGKVIPKSAHSIARFASNGMRFCIMPMSGETTNALASEATSDQCSKLDALLKQYQQVFDTPKTLPPLRTHDHPIPLEPGSGPVSVRPYR